jgi:hypothetical protein
MTASKRRLVLLATAVALVGGAVGVASAAQPGPIVHNGSNQTCLVFYHQDHSKPSYLCLNI